VDKKNTIISVKVSPEFRTRAFAAVQQTSADNFSRFLRHCLEDLVHKIETGERIAEPVQLLSETQRRRLERE